MHSRYRTGIYTDLDRIDVQYARTKHLMAHLREPIPQRVSKVQLWQMQCHHNVYEMQVGSIHQTSTVTRVRTLNDVTE